MKESPLVTSFIAARKVSVPLVVVRTEDPAATIATLATASAEQIPKLNGPAFKWDNINGLQPLDDAAAKAIGKVCGGNVDASISDAEMLVMVGKNAPPFSSIYMQNAHLFWREKQTLQAIWNLRDLFKQDTRILIMLTPAATPVPPELVNDVITFEEPLPTKEQLTNIVDTVYHSVNMKAKDTVKAVDALAGVRSAFMAEQATSMCMTKTGLDLDALWGQKKALINDTPGLTYIEPSIRFSDLGGCDALKEFFRLLFKGEAAPSVVIFMDEMDDMFAGVGSDTSGVSTVLHGKFLTQMTKTRAKGVILNGHPGVGKTAIVEAACAEFGVPLIALDFGDVKNGLVGASEQRAAQALAVIDAISFGKALYVGTCNSVGNLSPQLQRRFPWRFFFDLPTDAEKKVIWPIYEKKPHADAKGSLRPDQLKDRPDDKNWTGAEIRECCENAWRFNTTLRKAADFVVPIAQSMPEQIDERRKEAANRYLSASYPGSYQLTNTPHKGVETIPVAVPLHVARALADMKES